MTPLTQLLLVATISWSIWRSFRRHLAKNPLEVIRGPPCNTWLAGMNTSLRTRMMSLELSLTHLIAGHFDQLWDTKHGWKFHQAISDECTPETTRDVKFEAEETFHRWRGNQARKSVWSMQFGLVEGPFLNRILRYRTNPCLSSTPKL